MSELDVVGISLVEDNPRDAELTIRALRRHHLANRVFVVEDGAAAHPKVVLLDLKLPGMSGLEALRAIKADERTCSIPSGLLNQPHSIGVGRLIDDLVQRGLTFKRGP